MENNFSAVLSLRVHICFAIAMFLAVGMIACSGPIDDAAVSRTEIEAFVMPFCPQGRATLDELLRLRRETDGGYDLSVRYLAIQTTPRPNWITDFASTNGPGEAMAGLIGETVHRLYPDKLEAYLDAMANAPEQGWPRHVMAAGLDPTFIGAYALTPQGLDWYASNISVSQARGIERSPTLFVNGEQYTRSVIDRERLLYEVCDSSEGAGRFSQLCRTLPDCLDDTDCQAPAGGLAKCHMGSCTVLYEEKTELTVLVSDTLDRVFLDPSIEALQTLIPSAEVTFLSVGEDAGAALVQETEAYTLPVLVFDGHVKACTHFKTLEKMGFQSGEEGRVYKIGCLVPHPLPEYGEIRYSDDNRVSHWFPAPARATALQAVGQYDRAEELYLTYLAEYPDDTHVLTNLGNLCASDKRPEEAAGWFRKAIETDPHAELAYVGLEDLSDKEGWTEGLIFTQIQRGWLALDHNDPVAAAQFFSEVVASQPAYWMARFGLGKSLLASEDYPQAIKHLQFAHAWQPDDPRVISALAEAHRRCGSYDAAILCYREVVGLLPQDPVALGNLVYTLLDARQTEEAVVAMEGALEIVQTTPDLASKLIELYLQSGKEERAVELAGRSLEQCGTQHAALTYFAGHSFLQAEHSDKAHELFLACTNLEWPDEGYALHLVDALLGSGEVDEARRVLDKAVAAYPGNPICHAFKALLLLAREHDQATATQHVIWARQLGLSDSQQEALAGRLDDALHTDEPMANTLRIVLASNPHPSPARNLRPAR